MSAPTQPPGQPERGGGGVTLAIVSAAVFALGLGLDLWLSPTRAFWIGAEPGARALIATAAVIVAAALAQLLRLALGRPRDGEEGVDGRD